MDSILSTDTDGPSFVILNHDASDPDAVGSPRESLLNNWGSQFTSDVQQKLDQLVLENRELREALTQNNMAMKSQFDTLAMWQDEVFKTHQSHKEKFAQTRDLVLKLREENDNLRKELSSITAHEANNKTTVSEGLNSFIESMRQKLRTEEQRSKQLEGEKLILVKERDAFREECTRLNIKINSLENVIQQRTEEVISLRMGQHVSLSGSLRFPDGSLSRATRYMAECTPSDGESWVNLNETTLEPLTLVSTSSAVVKDLPNIEAWKAEKEKEYIDLEERYNILKADCEKTAEELKTIQSQYNELQRRLSEKTELLKSAIKELDEKKEEVSHLRQEFEEIAILKTQVDTYKQDYEAERRDREQQAEKNGELEEEIRRLRRNLEELQSRNSSDNRPRESTGIAESQGSQEQGFLCPVCGRVFTTEERCQAHVNMCLDGELNNDENSAINSGNSSV